MTFGTTYVVTKALRTIQIKNPVTAVVLSKDELPPQTEEIYT